MNLLHQINFTVGGIAFATPRASGIRNFLILSKLNVDRQSDRFEMP